MEDPGGASPTSTHPNPNPHPQRNPMFFFSHVTAKKQPRRRLQPPNGLVSPQPTGNPGSAVVYDHNLSYDLSASCDVTPLFCRHNEVNEEISDKKNDQFQKVSQQKNKNADIPNEVSNIASRNITTKANAVAVFGDRLHLPKHDLRSLSGKMSALSDFFDRSSSVFILYSFSVYFLL